MCADVSGSQFVWMCVDPNKGYPIEDKIRPGPASHTADEAGGRQKKLGVVRTATGSSRKREEEEGRQLKMASKRKETNGGRFRAK